MNTAVPYQADTRMHRERARCNRLFDALTRALALSMVAFCVVAVFCDDDTAWLFLAPVVALSLAVFAQQYWDRSIWERTVN